MTTTITNDYHHTSATVSPDADGYISASVVKRVRAELCGVAGCVCGGNLSERGPQTVEIEPLSDGRCRICPATA